MFHIVETSPFSVFHSLDSGILLKSEARFKVQFDPRALLRIQKPWIFKQVKVGKLREAGNLQAVLQWLKRISKVSLSVDLGSAKKLNHVEFLFKYPDSCRRHLGHEPFNFSISRIPKYCVLLLMYR